MPVPDTSSPCVWFQLLTRQSTLDSTEFASLWEQFTSGSTRPSSTVRSLGNLPREQDLDGEAFSGCPYDGIIEYWLDRDVSGLVEPPCWPGNQDESSPNSLVDPTSSTRFPTRANVVMKGDRSSGENSVKALFLVRRKEGMSVDEFQEYWAEQHAPLVRKTPGLDRYVQFHVHPDFYTSDYQPDFDGVGELRWPDQETFLSSWNSPEIQEEQFQDTPNFLRSGEVLSAVVEERSLFKA